MVSIDIREKVQRSMVLLWFNTKPTSVYEVTYEEKLINL